MAQCPMGSTCAANAGSARPRGPPSARTRVMSKSPPAEVATTEAATARRCWSSIVGDTPTTACPYCKAAVPPVRISRSVRTPVRRSLRKRPHRFLNLASRARRTCALRLRPAPSPLPSETARCRYSIVRSGNSLMICNPICGRDAQHTFFVSDNVRRMAMKRTKMSVTTAANC